jgi:hypothetical protein
VEPGTRYVMSRIPFDRDAIPLKSLGSETFGPSGFEAGERIFR